MEQPKKILAFKIYLILAALFITSLVVCNLIFLKFFVWSPIDTLPMELSVGLLPYPLTFLITDLISEIYGKKKANQVVIAGIFASIFSMGIILVAELIPAMETSRVTDDTFTTVFGLSPVAVLASMLAYLFAQFIDIRLFHFWKDYTNGKHLWLRNNFSTFTSQFVDSFTVIFLLCSFNVFGWDKFVYLLLSGFFFKVMVAMIDTPFLYFFVWLFRKKFNLKVGEEINLGV